MKTIIHRYIGMLLLRVFHPNVYSMQWKNKNCMQSTRNGLVINKVQSGPLKVSTWMFFMIYKYDTIDGPDCRCMIWWTFARLFLLQASNLSNFRRKFFLEVTFIFQSLHCLKSRVKNTLSLCHNNVKKGLESIGLFRLVLNSKNHG